MKYCKFCGKEINGRSSYCNLREKKLYLYNTSQKGLSPEDVLKQSKSILELADIKGKPYKSERMHSVSLPINSDIRGNLENLFGYKLAEFLRNELAAYLCLPENRKRYGNSVILDKTYSLLLPLATKEFLELTAKKNLRSGKKELTLFMYILNEKLVKLTSSLTEK